MSTIIAILLWLRAILPGSYTQTEFDAIQSSHQAQISAIQGDPILLAATSTENPSLVTIECISEGD